MKLLLYRRGLLGLGVGCCGIIMILAFQNFSNPPTNPLGNWPLVSLDFNSNNILTTDSLINPQNGAVLRTEPLDPRATGELGPANTAIGRPKFFKAQDSQTGFPDITGTIAPGSQYTVGFQSECIQVPNIERCARDNAFYIRLDANSRDKTKDNSIQDKAFFRPVQVTHPKALAMNDGEPLIRYFSFDFKFDRYYERSRTWTMHMQAYQEGGGPALSLQMIRTTDAKTPAAQQELEMSVIALNDRVFNSFEPPNSPSAIKHQGSFAVIDVCPKTNIKFVREKWYNITLKMAPSAVVDSDGKEKGEIAFFVDGVLKCRYVGNWGFKPSDPSIPHPAMALDLGIYRARTESQQMITFDNVKYGPTIKSVWETGTSRVSLPSLPNP